MMFMLVVRKMHFANAPIPGGCHVSFEIYWDRLGEKNIEGMGILGVMFDLQGVDILRFQQVLSTPCYAIKKKRSGLDLHMKFISHIHA